MYIKRACRYLILALDVALFLLKAIGGIENGVKGESSKYIRSATHIRLSDSDVYNI